MIRVLATAGHVDHGKSTLVEALTGTHPDRLKEEREREMSIDLGFAYLRLPGGLEVGIVDVPGHRDFIANMLAGVGGVDAVLLVVAADEGVMPQTREHVAILDLLGIDAGVVAITKVDLAPDPEWLALVEEDVRHLLAPTTLARAPMVRVSARTGQGLPDLVQALERVLRHARPREDRGRPRLPVDRAFVLTGFGPVVTGTLMDGWIQVGDEVEVLPQGFRARVRGVHVHRRPRPKAPPGARTALNLSGVSRHQLDRGQVVVRPGTYRPTQRVDAFVRVLPDAPIPLRHNQWLKLHVWTSETLARVRLLGADELAPGQSGWVQLEVREPLVVAYGDRFILRRPSPEATVGGGVVLVPHPRGRHPRFRAAVLARLEALYRRDARAVVQQYLDEHGFLGPQGFAGLPLPRDQVQQALAHGARQGEVLMVATEAGPYWVAPAAWQAWNARAHEVLQRYHQRHPMRRGMPLAQFQEAMGLPPALFAAWLRRGEEEGRWVRHRERVALPDHRPRFPPEVQARVEALLQRFAQGERLPNRQECLEAVGEEAFLVLVEQGRLVPLDDRYVVDRATYRRWMQQVHALLQEGPRTTGQLRQALGASRRLVVAFLEHLDRQGLTRREGDVRVWVGAPPVQDEAWPSSRDDPGG